MRKILVAALRHRVRSKPSVPLPAVAVVPPPSPQPTLGMRIVQLQVRSAVCAYAYEWEQCVFYYCVYMLVYVLLMCVRVSAASPVKSVLATSTAGLKTVANAISATLEYDPWESLNSFLGNTRGTVTVMALHVCICVHVACGGQLSYRR